LWASPVTRKKVIFDLMKRTKDVITKNGLLKWLTKTVLVLGLIAFSGHVSELRLYNSEPTKTELNEVRRVNSKRTVNFKKVFGGLNCPLLYSTSRTEKFTSFLLQLENRIAVKLKSNFEERPTNEQRGFFIYYSTESSEEFDTNQLRG
jgi:hypothetical protein